MKENNRNEYVREYIKETYKTVKVYIRRLSSYSRTYEK